MSLANERKWHHCLGCGGLYLVFSVFVALGFGCSLDFLCVSLQIRSWNPTPKLKEGVLEIVSGQLNGSNKLSFEVHSSTTLPKIKILWHYCCARVMHVGVYFTLFVGETIVNHSEMLDQQIFLAIKWLNPGWVYRVIPSSFD